MVAINSVAARLREESELLFTKKGNEELVALMREAAREIDRLEAELDFERSPRSE